MTSQAEGVAVNTPLISEINEEAYDLRIKSHKGQLECRTSIEVHNPEHSISQDELITLLKMLDISETVDQEQIAEFCTDAANGENPQNVLLASGTEATNWVDDYFELFVETGDEGNIELEEDDRGRVDFKNIQSFTNVKQEQLIGTIYLPKPGENGKTITGIPILAKAGKVAGVLAGNGVEIRDNGTNAFAV